ncbi:MAG: hypothetical protein KKC75_05555 [Nanoarchaeota archaeon]|nr:hypothetical protein [Nanoarchaeota archaeon]MBU1005243.1 hypothetical protein [Nanoarchaeota archaeon]MBU1945790.1 hypothetical protein [Nanoarchaeota archaeon]
MKKLQLGGVRGHKVNQGIRAAEREERRRREAKSVSTPKVIPYFTVVFYGRLEWYKSLYAFLGLNPSANERYLNVGFEELPDTKSVDAIVVDCFHDGNEFPAKTMLELLNDDKGFNAKVYLSYKGDINITELEIALGGKRYTAIASSETARLTSEISSLRDRKLN